MKKETVFALRMRKKHPGIGSYSYARPFKIERTNIALLSFLKIGTVHLILSKIDSPFKKFQIIPEGKDVSPDDPVYELAPNKYKIIFSENSSEEYTEADILNYIKLLPETIWVKSIEIKRKTQDYFNNHEIQ